MLKRGEVFAVLFCTILLIAPVLGAQQSSEDLPPPPKNAEVEHLQVTYRYQDDGTGQEILAARLRILTEQGLKLYGAVYLPYSSQLETLDINYLRTIKPGGKSVPADPSKAMDVTPPVTRAAPMFSDVRVKVLVAPQLQVGDEVEYQYTRSVQTPYMPGNFWVSYSLNRANPIDSATVVLDVPAGRKLTFESDPCFHYTVGKKGGRKLYRWDIKKLEPPKALYVYRPPLFSASTLSDWRQVAEWYAGLQSRGQQMTPELQALAAKLTAGQKTPEEKLDAIYAYVSEQIRYVALEFGIGGYQAHPAALVLANGYGDCKDKSGLLQALLAAAGIKSYPALVNAVQEKIEPAVPMPSQFDHVMTVVPLGGAGGKTLWLDSTMQTAPPGVLSPAVEGKQALLVMPGGSRLVSVPDSPPVPPRSAAIANGALDAGGKLTLKESIQAEGILGVLMRQVFRLRDRKQLESVITRVAEVQVGGSTASGWSSSDPDNLVGPFNYQCTLTRPAYIDLLQARQQVPIPRVLIGPNQWRGVISIAREKTKQETSGGCASGAASGIKLYGPVEDNETVELTVPANYQFDLPEPIQVKRAFGSYSSSYEIDHGRLEVRRDLKITAATVPLSQLDALENFQELVNADLDQRLTMRRTGGADLMADASSMTAGQLTTAGYEALFKHRQPVLARDLLLKAVTKDPNSKTAWNALGAAYLGMGDFYQAEKNFKKQLAINPYDRYAYNNLGRTELVQQHFGQAISYYKQELSVDPLDRQAITNLGGAFDHQRDWAEAAGAYGKSVRIIPNNALLYAAWGSSLLRAGKLDEGRRAMAQALEISKSPVVLNNVAYAMAEAGVDLSKAEEDARSAVAQAAPAGATSLDVPKNYSAKLATVASFLDTLGFVLYKQGQIAEAGPCLRAAFEIRPGPDVSLHLALLAMKQGDSAEALRYYEYTIAQFNEQHPYVPEVLKSYVAAHGGAPEMTAARVARIRKEEQALRSLAPAADREFTWPATAAGTVPASWVALNIFVNAGGSVGDAKVFRGSEPFSSAALADVKLVHFRPLDVDKNPLATVREVYFLYDAGAPPNERVMAFSRPGSFTEPADNSNVTIFNLNLLNQAVAYFMIQGHTHAGLQLLAQNKQGSKEQIYERMANMGRLLRFSGDLDASATVLRQASALEPKDDFAYRELAETLKAVGDPTAAIQAEQQVLQLDPDDAATHYSLGAEYEVVAGQGAGRSSGVETGKKRNLANAAARTASRDSLHQALQQYSLAANLDPANTKYAGAYAALYEKVYHRAPRAALKTGMPEDQR